MNLIPDKESLTVEFKSDTVKLPDSEIFEAVVAFANTEGGDLYLGVEDDGTVTGVNKAHKN
ncbi:MAG: ATP-binding protein, partial [Abditibacteriota bacterium]|nr:ATP-binding protein [Abditibacteriota bacterium]